MPEVEARGRLSIRSDFSSMEQKFQRRGGKTQSRNTGKWNSLSLFPSVAHGILSLLSVVGCCLTSYSQI